MPAYVTLTKVKSWLPSGHGISDDDLNTIIGDSSEEIEEMAGKLYVKQYETNTQKFPDIDDDPATPKTIELCTLWLVLAESYARIEIDNSGDESNTQPKKKYYRDKAEAKMTKVAAGEIDIDISVENPFYAEEKYPDDETDFDRKFTNDELDTYTYS